MKGNDKLPSVGLATLVFGLVSLTLLLAPSGALAFGDVSVTRAGAGAATGNVKSQPAGIDCGSDCFQEFIGAPPPSVNLTATPGPGFILIGWSGAPGCEVFPVPNPCEIAPQLLTPTNVTATFDIAPAPPVAHTDLATEIDEDGATLRGRVDPEGSSVGACRFEYGTTAAYGASLPCSPAASGLGNGTADVAVSAQTPPLEAGTTYHYRLVAANPGGASKGGDRTFATTGTPVCPNVEHRLEQGIATILLPDCMALEQVSPPLKDNQPARFPTISDTGARVLFNSSAALAGNPGVLGIDGESYVATRTPSGWQTAYTRQPAEFTAGWSGAKSFSPDLSEWLHIVATGPQLERGESRAFRAGGGLFEPLSPPLVPLANGVRNTVLRTTFQGASADHSHLFFIPGREKLSEVSPIAFIPGDPTPTGSSAVDNAYVAHLDQTGEPSLELLARDTVGPDAGKAWGGTCGSNVGGNTLGGNGLVAANRGAISADGTHSFFSTRPGQPASGTCSTANRLRILERTESPAGTQISEPIANECTRVSPACKTEGELNGDDLYLGASQDQSKLYFSTVRQLASSDLDTTSDVYLYEAGKSAGSRLTQVSAGGTGDATPGSGANASSLFALSGDGTHVYFVSTDVLTTTPNPVLPAAQQTATAGQRNLYLWDYATGQTSFVARLTSDDSGAYPVPLVGANPQVGGDGHILLFNSKSPLTANDDDGGFRDIFRYDSTAPDIVCVSCAGNEDTGHFDTIARFNPSGAGTDFAEAGRWVSEDGQTVVFVTGEDLAPEDADGVIDSYLWRRSGGLNLLPGTADPERTANPSRGLLDRPTLSHDGSEVGFQSAVSLLSSDRDSTKDVYVARVGGGFEFPPSPEHCTGEACQGVAPVPPVNRRSAPPSGEGNPPASKSCPKGKVRRNGRCVKKKAHHRKRKHARHNRRGGK